MPSGLRPYWSTVRLRGLQRHRASLRNGGRRYFLSFGKVKKRLANSLTTNISWE